MIAFIIVENNFPKMKYKNIEDFSENRIKLKPLFSEQQQLFLMKYLLRETF